MTKMSKLKNTPNNQTLYTLKFNFNYINCSKFKEKELIILRNIISGSRIGQNFYFYKYANISFDESDKKHEYPIVSELDNFGRSKTNGIIFKISNNIYNRCLIYQTSSKECSFYGYIIYNTETGEYSHNYNLEYEINALLRNINIAISLYGDRS